MSRAQANLVRQLLDAADAGDYTVPAELVAARAAYDRVAALTLPDSSFVDVETAARGIVDATARGDDVDLATVAEDVRRVTADAERRDVAQRVLAAAVELAGDDMRRVTAGRADAIISPPSPSRTPTPSRARGHHELCDRRSKCPCATRLATPTVPTSEGAVETSATPSA